METRLRDLLSNLSKEKATPGRNKWSHATTYGDKLFWNLNNEKKADFWFRYCEWLADLDIERAAENFLALPVGERVHTELPVVVDVRDRKSTRLNSSH